MHLQPEPAGAEPTHATCRLAAYGSQPAAAAQPGKRGPQLAQHEDKVAQLPCGPGLQARTRPSLTLNASSRQIVSKLCFPRST